MLMKRVILFLVSLFFVASCFAQSIETGYVKEYNGKKAKTPLAGVELSVNGAPSTVSDTRGKFQLKFAVLKPGESVKYNEIYKAGYVIFNKDALDYWRISKDKKPFVIVMCKESAFRELKKKYYGIIEKSYREEYLKQRALAEQSAADVLNLQTKLAELKKEYDEKLSNINTYVELFARIDHSEMDSIVGRALELVEAGRIDEGIKVFEELQLLQQVNYQLDKWQTGENMRQAAEAMIDDAQRDLVSLADKLKQQIGLYEMGGHRYDEKRKDMMVNLITVYRQLNSAFDGHYNEELGTWICQLSDFTKPWADRETDYREAAALPSLSGLYKLADRFEIKAYYNNAYIDTIKTCLQEALKLFPSDSIRKEIENALLWCGDFYYPTLQGDLLCYKCYGGIDSVYVWPKTRYCYNKATDTLVIPSQVEYNGKTYTVAGIGPYAFFKNRHLKKVVLPPDVEIIYPHAFDKCDSLASISVSSNMKQIDSDAIPLHTFIELPQHMDNIDWTGPFASDRLLSIEKAPDTSYYVSTRRLLTELSERKELDYQTRAYWTAQIGFLDFYHGDTINYVNYLFKARKVFGSVIDYDIAQAYFLQGDYKTAFEYLNSYLNNNPVQVAPPAYNKLAYMNAKGLYIDQNYQLALELIDKAIALEPQNIYYLDTKGEIYLMMGQRDSAHCYWNKVLAINPEFDYNQSDLYKQLFPEQVNQNKDSTTILFQDYLNIVHLAANSVYNIQMLDAFTEIGYDILDEKGTLALEVLFQHKESIKRYDPVYIGTAIMWAIRNELRYICDWFWPIYFSKSSDRTTAKKTENPIYWEDGQMIDVSNLSISRALYHVALLLNNELQPKINAHKQLSNSEEYIKDFTTRIIDAIDIMKASESIPNELKGTISDLVFTGKSFHELSEEYNIPYEDMVRHCARVLESLPKQSEWNK